MNSRILFFNLAFFCFVFLSCAKENDITLKSEESLCSQLKNLELDIGFSDKVNFLYKNAQKTNYEEGFAIFDNGILNRYEYFKGDVNSPSLKINLTKKIDGILHNHYSSLYPIFSVGDLNALYEIIKGGFIRDDKTFLFGLVSFNGTSYLIKFIDFEKSLMFFNKNFFDSNTIAEMDMRYKRLRDIYLVDNNLIQAGELAFLDLMDSSGIALLRGNGVFNKWVRIEKGAANLVIEVPCDYVK